MYLPEILATRVQQIVAALVSPEVADQVRVLPAPPGRGDVAICTAPIAQAAARKGLQVNAPRLADDLAQRLVESVELCGHAQADGVYVNIRVHEGSLLRAAERAPITVLRVPHSERIMVEYLSPNTNKPLHLGHIRNGVLGSTLVRLLSDIGHTVVSAILVNDRGVHICASMLAYQRYGDGATPESSEIKGDHFVGQFYVRFSQEKKAAEREDGSSPLDEEAAALLKRWEAGDRDVHTLWGHMNQWVYDGFGVTEDRFGFTFDVRYYESELYQLGKDIARRGLEGGIFTRTEEGGISYPLPVAEFGLNAYEQQNVVGLLRGDGTSNYLTQDLGVAVLKADRHDLDRSIYVVACEQDRHFATLFSILRQLGYRWANSLYHLSYEMVELPEGRMKSREGTVIDADDLADELRALARAELEKRGRTDCDESEIDRRAEVIGMAAIKFFFAIATTTKRIKFDSQRSLRFDGDTGPYVLYTYARARSILRRAQAAGFSVTSQEATLGDTASERELAVLLSFLPDTIYRCGKAYDTAGIARAALSLAKAFNRFYNEAPILTSELSHRRGRLLLTNATVHMLDRLLGILGIETLEEM
mgnify:CR=1 FL=1